MGNLQANETQGSEGEGACEEIYTVQSGLRKTSNKIGMILLNRIR